MMTEMSNFIRKIYQGAVQKVNEHFLLFLFTCFLVMFLFFGQLLTYNYDFLTNVFDVYFWADTPRVIEDLAKFGGNHSHYHSMVHIFIVFFINPLVSILQSIIHNNVQSIVILESVIGSACVCIVYSILNCITHKKQIALTFAVLFGFSFSTILFSAIPESYIFSAFFQLIFWRYIVQLVYIDKPEKLSVINILTLSLLGVISQEMIFSNFILFLIGIIYLLREIYQHNFKKCALNFFYVLAASLVIFQIIYAIQTLTWGHITNIFDVITNYRTTGLCGDFRYMNLHFTLEKFANTLTQTLASPIALAQVYMWPNENENTLSLPVFAVDDQFSIWNLITLFSFYLLPLVFFIKKFKNFPNKGLIVALISIVATSFIFHMFYGYTIGPSESILFSQNYLYAVFIALGLIISEVNSEKVLLIFRLLIQYVLILNIFQIFKIKQYLYYLTLLKNNDFAGYLIFALILTVIIVTAHLVSKKFVHPEVINKPLCKKFEFFLWGYCIFVVLYAFLSHIDKF